MKKNLTILCLLLILQLATAANFYDQLCAFNFNWKKYSHRAPQGPARTFQSDKEYIQAHLQNVLTILRGNTTAHLDEAQRRSRMLLLQLLDDYRQAGRFPVNDTRQERIPVFIDRNFTHCAVAYLLQQTGHEDLALRIAQADNFAWVKDITADGLLQWQQASGLSLEEVKLIQGAYDFYEPRGYELPNKYELPQKPSCITLYFETTNSWRKQHPGKQAVWCRGEGSNGILNGRWEQNYSADLPWIIGYYQNGKRTGQWFEYYPGTNLLCRTEYWDHDKLNGTRTRFDQEGKIIEEIQFKDGVAITKINYDRSDSLKWVRQPVDSLHVNTKVYTLNGKLLATGMESIYNPGNLQWFQNIELTALNSAAISARNNIQTSVMINDNYSGMRRPVFFSPPLVQYKKEGAWLYFQDCAPQFSNPVGSRNIHEVLHLQFRHFGPGISQSLAMYADAAPVAGYHSLRVVYDNDILQDFYGFGQLNYSHMKIWYHIDKDKNPVYRYVFDRRGMFHAGQPIVKAIGTYDRYNQRVGTWDYFDQQSRLYKTEQYILPKKEEEEEYRVSVR